MRVYGAYTRCCGHFQNYTNKNTLELYSRGFTTSAETVSTYGNSECHGVQLDFTQVSAEDGADNADEKDHQLRQELQGAERRSPSGRLRSPRARCLESDSPPGPRAPPARLPPAARRGTALLAGPEGTAGCAPVGRRPAPRAGWRRPGCPRPAPWYRLRRRRDRHVEPRAE